VEKPQVRDDVSCLLDGKTGRELIGLNVVQSVTDDQKEQVVLNEATVPRMTRQMRLCDRGSSETITSRVSTYYCILMYSSSYRNRRTEVSEALETIS
jgi:hypothetical protein